jgi:hypothetical protein
MTKTSGHAQSYGQSNEKSQDSQRGCMSAMGEFRNCLELAVAACQVMQPRNRILTFGCSPPPLYTQTTGIPAHH